MPRSPLEIRTHLLEVRLLLGRMRGPLQEIQEVKEAEIQDMNRVVSRALQLESKRENGMEQLMPSRPF